MAQMIRMACGNAETCRGISELGRFVGEGNGNHILVFCFENFMDRGAWQPTVHGVTKSRYTKINTHTHSLQKILK